MLLHRLSAEVSCELPVVLESRANISTAVGAWNLHVIPFHVHLLLSCVSLNCELTLFTVSKILKQILTLFLNLTLTLSNGNFIKDFRRDVCSTAEVLKYIFHISFLSNFCWQAWDLWVLSWSLFYLTSPDFPKLISTWFLLLSIELLVFLFSSPSISRKTIFFLSRL